MKIHAKIYTDGELVVHTTNSFSKPREFLPTREDRLEHALHAEMRAMIQDKSEGYKKLVMNLAPCKQCAGYIAESDIDEVVIPAEIPERWREGWNSCVDGFNILSAAGKKITMSPIDSGEEI